MKLYVRGQKPLIGEVTVQGAKNSVPKLMVASLLSETSSSLSLIPNISDVSLLRRSFASFNVPMIEMEDEVIIDPSRFSFKEMTHSNSRIPLLLIAPLLHRSGIARVPLPEGCRIGERPIDFHLQIFKEMSLSYQMDGDFLEVVGSPKPASIYLPYPSVGATEQFLLLAALTDGTSRLENAAVEPEIKDLIDLLVKMGARISLSRRTLIVRGVASLTGQHFNPVPDRLEAASWAVAAALTDGRIRVKNASEASLRPFLDTFVQIGGRVEYFKDAITFSRGDLEGIHLETDVFPGLSTDHQPPLALLLTQAEGTSSVHETVYENRVGFGESLQRMGAEIVVSNNCPDPYLACRFQGKSSHTLHIEGARELKGTKLYVPDLRAGFTFLLAGLSARGVSSISNAELLSRGYPGLLEKLQGLGADVHAPDEVAVS